LLELRKIDRTVCEDCISKSTALKIGAREIDFLETTLIEINIQKGGQGKITGDKCLSLKNLLLVGKVKPRLKERGRFIVTIML
jgi:hypothetical protein